MTIRDINQSSPNLSNPLPVRGEVWRVTFDPTKGDEIRKNRPAVVISTDAYTPLRTKIVVPITSWQEKFVNLRWMVKIPADDLNGLERDSAADTLQIRCVSYERFVSKLGTLQATTVDNIATTVAIIIEVQ